jgi:hypothetical protein
MERLHNVSNGHGTEAIPHSTACPGGTSLSWTIQQVIAPLWVS